MTKGLSGKMLMEHRDDQRQSTTHELEAVYFGLGVTYCGGDRVRWIWHILGRECEADPEKGDLSAYWVGISSVRDFLSTTPSYTPITDMMFRLCHRLIACNIVGRSQAPEKVIVTDLFYLRGMDVGSINISYHLDRYLRLFASRRKREAMISGGTSATCSWTSKQREVMDSMPHDFSRFTTWTVTELSRMMNQAGVRIKPGREESVE
nr:hypothetical protein [Tanacetum cinerariifolium]